jgi:phage/plasmid-associated DNA primase
MFENYIKFSVNIGVDKNNKKKVTGHKKDWQKLNESRYNGEDNFAVLTGETNDLILIDLDKSVDKSGVEWYTKSFGHELEESETLVTGTINGGYHLYFKYDSRISSNSADKELLVDIKSNSGCGYQGKGYPIVLEKPPRKLTEYEIGKVLELQGKTPKKRERVIIELNEASSSSVLDRKINKFIGLPEETTWEKSVTLNGYKAVPDCRECVVNPTVKHSTDKHSCIFLNTNPHSVTKSCFSCGVVPLDKKNSKKCMEYFKVIIDTHENNTYQELTKDLIDYCNGMFRRKKNSGHVYKKVKSYAYEPFMNAEDFINKVFLGDDTFLNNVNNMDNLVKFMKKINHPEFGFLEVNQEYLGFTNGILNTRTLEFTNESLVPGDLIVRKYFNQEFTGNTCTPLMDKILDYQFTPIVRDFIYTCLGRMFEIRDNYGFMLYLQGEPGCGKSVVLDVISECFNNVGAISSTFEQKFGLGYLYDKDIVICDDIPEDIGKVLDQTTFQTITTNGMVSVAIKGGDGFSLKWTVPLLFAGNYSLKYKDKGQISRRVIVANFEKSVRKPDVSLKRRIIAEELPQFIYKCLKMYNDLLQKGENKDIWSLCPEYFKDQQQELRMDRNPLFKFLSLYTIFMKDNVITMSDVREKFNEVLGLNVKRCLDNGTFAQVNEDYIVQVLKICKHCNKEAMSGCCEKYSHKDRSMKKIVRNMGFVQGIMND